jgi:hypothetical protein
MLINVLASLPQAISYFFPFVLVLQVDACSNLRSSTDLFDHVQYCYLRAHLIHRR